MQSAGSLVPTHKVEPDTIDQCKAEVQLLRQTIVDLGSLSDMQTTIKSLAHELAQPIAAASNYLAAARRSASNSKYAAIQQPAEAIGLAEQCLLQAGGVIRDAKSSASGHALQTRPVDVAGMVAEIFALYGTGWNILPVIEIEPAAARIMGDPIQLTQVLLNLIRNAVEATRERPHRSIRLTALLLDDAMVEIGVEDDGCGIAETLKNTLFSPLTSTKPDGLGIGLSICRTIIERHGGRIWAETLPVGTRFCFTVRSA